MLQLTNEYVIKTPSMYIHLSVYGRSSFVLVRVISDTVDSSREYTRDKARLLLKTARDKKYPIARRILR